MICSKEDLKHYIREDKKRNLGTYKVGFLKYLAKLFYGTDDMKAFQLLKALRELEYAKNVLSKKNFLGKLIYAWRKYCYHRLEERCNIVIGANMVGYGFRIPHIIGGGIIINANSIGNYCGANVGVVVGNNHSWDDRPTIGNHVALTMGCKVYGRISIGDNVIVAPNSVVVKDVPDNCVVSGIPAKIIRQDGHKVE